MKHSFLKIGNELSLFLCGRGKPEDSKVEDIGRERKINR